MGLSKIPVTCYRLQLNRNFTFASATAILDYLSHLGITTVYLSPILQSKVGSDHGYDVTDPTRIDSKLGGEQQLEAFQMVARERNMGLLLDVVPNHMAASPENPWWMDVLENGPGSVYSSYFDIDWHPPSRLSENKILLPVLGGFYADVLKKRELQLVFQQGRFLVRYYDSLFPIAPKSYRNVLTYRQELLEKKLGSDSPAFQEYLGIIAELDALVPRETLPVYAAGERRLHVAALKERIKELHDSDLAFRRFLNDNVRHFNGIETRDRSFRLLDRLLSEQSYDLSYWNGANAEINYRRFFNVAELIGVRVEDPAVMESTHSTILRLIESGAVTGLRIDHIDGLRDPLGYLQRLKHQVQAIPGRTNEELYVLVEKILSGNEALPADWPVCGTTGYEFLNAVNRIFVYPQGVLNLERAYRRATGITKSCADLLFEKKKLIMTSLLAVEMRYLGHQLSTLAQQDRYARELPASELVQAFSELTACLPVYRTYVRGMDVPAHARFFVNMAMEEARKRNPGIDQRCFSFITDVLLGSDSGEVYPEQREARLAFVLRWQQLTGAIMAKGFEDTLLYVYFPLLALNDVGGDPRPGALQTANFSAFVKRRSKNEPYGLNTTATHDTKRGEDVRARINVLSEMSEEWSRRVKHWIGLNAAARKMVRGEITPDRNEEIYIYQTLAGAWPLNAEEFPQFRKRMTEYIRKANREAKVHTRWTNPNPEREVVVEKFVNSLTSPAASNRFRQGFVTFHKKIAYFGAINGLAQVLVKLTTPGIPDVYQGGELWDLHLVDPDNRGAVDYEARKKIIEQMERCCGHGMRAASYIEEIVNGWRDGRVKFYTTWKAANFRRDNPRLFLNGSYEVLKVTGKRAENVFAFARFHGRRFAIVVVPKWLAASKAPMSQKSMPGFWGGTAVALPKRLAHEFRNIFTDQKLKTARSRGDEILPVAQLLGDFPVACLRAE
jgi:(1->4)-alpha-D-glucan 1-alpha-D-glucosylmutase